MRNIYTFVISFLLASIIKAQPDSVIFVSSNLPIFVINTHGKTIVNEPKIIVDLGIIYNGEDVRNNISDSFNHYNGKIGIEIRGSSSQMFDKKQYGFETVDSSSEERNVSLLGFPEESDWILYAPYSDKSLIRNILIYRLSNDINRYASRTKLCELILDGKYMGVYVLMEKIKRDKNRVDISKLEEADTTGDDLTGGYIIKVDKEEGGINDGWISTFPPSINAWQRIYFQYHYPKPEDITEAQKNYIRSLIDTFETRTYDPGFDDETEGYAKFIDVNSFVDFFILNELAKNVDSYRLSAFYYKDRDSEDEKLKAGPIWDFNLGFGNSDYYNASITRGWHLDYETYSTDFLNGDYWQAPFWWKKIFSDKDFKSKIAQRWMELRENNFSNERIYAIVDSLVELLSESQQRNFVKWPVLGEYVWPNYYVGETYSDEINYLKDWISDRLDWMDQELNKSLDTPEEIIIPVDFILYQNYPNPFNPTTKIKFTVPGVETRHASSLLVTFKVYDLLGREITTLIKEEKQPGFYEVEWDGSNLSSGVYFYTLTAGDFKATRKLILAK